MFKCSYPHIVAIVCPLTTLETSAACSIFVSQETAVLAKDLCILYWKFSEGVHKTNLFCKTWLDDWQSLFHYQKSSGLPSEFSHYAGWSNPSILNGQGC